MTIMMTIITIVLLYIYSILEIRSYLGKYNKNDAIMPRAHYIMPFEKITYIKF
jgi:hypothetical protein